MYWPVGPCRRGLHSPSPMTSNDSVPKFGLPVPIPASITIHQSSSNSSTGSDTDDTVINGESKEGTERSKGDYFRKEGRFGNVSSSSLSFNRPSSRKSNNGTRNWTLWSIWSEGLNELLEGIRGRRIQIEEETFINAIMTTVQDLCEDFPVDLFSKEFYMFKLNKSDDDSGICYDEIDLGSDNDEIRFEAVPIVFRLPDKKAESKSSASSAVSLSCVGSLSEILVHVLEGNELLLIHGGVIITVESNTSLMSDARIRILDLNHVNTWKVPVHIVRLNPTPISGNKKQADGLRLLEMIKPDIGNHYFFKYAASRHSQSKKIERHRVFQAGTYAAPRGPLEETLFPISKDMQASDAFEAILNYDWQNDPTWPEFKGGRGSKYDVSTKQKSNAEAFSRNYIPPPIRYYDHHPKGSATSQCSPPLLTFSKSTPLNAANQKRSEWSWESSNQAKKPKKNLPIRQDRHYCYCLFFALSVIFLVFVTLWVIYNHFSLSFPVTSIAELAEMIKKYLCELIANVNALTC